MDAISFAREMAVNRSAYEQLREQIRQQHAGQYVAWQEARLSPVLPLTMRPTRPSHSFARRPPAS